jgi:hypothetical protein
VLWVLVLLPVPPTAAEVQVRAANGLVDVRAQGAPLSEVLERLADQTGMKVRYDGAPQRVQVTVALQGRTPAQAVLSILDGLGLDYALSMDTTGTRVGTLLIAGVAPTVPAEPESKGPARSVGTLPAHPEPESDEESPPESEPEVTEKPRTPSEEAQSAVAAAIAVATGTKTNPRGSGLSPSADDGSSSTPP